MQINKMLTVSREYDKLCVLEHLIGFNRELELIINEFIEVCSTDQTNKIACFRKLKERIKDVRLLAKVTQLCISIAYDTPIQLCIDDMQHIKNMGITLIEDDQEFLNEPFIPLFVSLSITY